MFEQIALPDEILFSSLVQESENERFKNLQSEGCTYIIFTIQRAGIFYSIEQSYKDSKHCYFIKSGTVLIETLTYVYDSRYIKPYYSFEDAFDFLDEICSLHLFYFCVVYEGVAGYVTMKLVEKLIKTNSFVPSNSMLNEWQIVFNSFILNQSYGREWCIRYDPNNPETPWKARKGEICYIWYSLGRKWSERDPIVENSSIAYSEEEWNDIMDQLGNDSKNYID